MGFYHHSHAKPTKPYTSSKHIKPALQNPNPWWKQTPKKQNQAPNLIFQTQFYKTQKTKPSYHPPQVHIVS